LKIAKKPILGIIMLMLCACIVTASAFVYETAQHTVNQTVKNIATLTVQNSALGNIEEGETKAYTKATVSSLGGIVGLATTKDNVYLHFNSDTDALTTYFTSYTITVKYAAVGAGSSHNVGDTACSMSIASPDPSGVTLDKSGTWSFDFEISATAQSVSSDQATTVTIIVTAEST
jgi:hypothetical protein